MSDTDEVPPWLRPEGDHEGHPGRTPGSRINSAGGALWRVGWQNVAHEDEEDETGSIYAPHGDRWGRWDGLRWPWHRTGQQLEKRYSWMWQHPHISTAVVSSFFLLLFAGLFSYALGTLSDGAIGGMWVLGILLVTVWLASLVLLVPHRAVLWANFVMVGSFFIIYLRHADEVPGIVLYCLQMYPYVPMSTFFLYFLGPMITLKDRSSFPQSSMMTPKMKRPLPEGTLETIIDDDIEDADPAISGSFRTTPGSKATAINFAEYDFVVPVTVPCWKRPYYLLRAYFIKHPYRHIVFHNFCYLIPYVLALHWGFATRVLPNVDLSPSSFAAWGPKDYAAVIVGVAIIASIAVYQLYLFYKHRAQTFPLIKWYVLAYGLSIVFVVTQTILARTQGLEFHLHHYFLAVIFFPFTRFDNPISAVVQGFLLGLHLDGMVHWGMAALWVVPPPDPTH